jgi:hypothetical protein
MNPYWYRNILGWCNIGLALLFLFIGTSINPFVAITMFVITGCSGVILIRDALFGKKPFWYGGK